MLFLRYLLACIFFFQSFLFNASALFAADPLSLPSPGQMVSLSASFHPLLIEGLQYDPKLPFRFGFIIRPGDKKVSDSELQDESMGLVKYFLATLTLPQEDVWVNLSPYEKDRIIPQNLAFTRLGGDLLAQDYILKQLASSLIFPDGQVGQVFWKEVYASAMQHFGRIDVPINTFNKVWIVPGDAQVFVHGNTVVVTKSHLKVMMEEDYLATQKSKHVGVSSFPGRVPGEELSNAVMRQVVLPVLENEVNKGTLFAPLRQILNAAILAEWYKRHLKESLVARYYADQHKIAGINEPSIKDQIYNQYLKAYKKGVYNFIREDSVPGMQGTVPRKYFSGGLNVVIHRLDEATDPRELSAQSRQALGNQDSDRMMEVGLSEAGDNAIKAVNETPASADPIAAFMAAEENQNPFWTYTVHRLNDQRVYLADKDPQLINLLLTKRVRLTQGFYRVETGPLGNKPVFEGRMAKNEELGTPKGGIRYIGVKELMETPFGDVWRRFLALPVRPTVAQADALLTQWFDQELDALSTWGMTGKSAGLERKLGGAKGLVFKGGIIEGEDHLPAFEAWDEKGLTERQRLEVDLRVADHHSRELAEANAVGRRIDSPAPDVGTSPEILEKYNDTYIRVLTERGADAFILEGRTYGTGNDALYFELYQRLKRILDRVDRFTIFQNPFLEECVRFSNEHPGLPMPWNGVDTGKRYERPIEDADISNGTASTEDITRGTIKMGGVIGRTEATGEGIVMVLKHFLYLTNGGHEGKTMAVHAFGNVGRYTARAAAREHFDVLGINDFGVTFFHKTKWSEAEINNIIQAMIKYKTKKLYDLWITHPEFFNEVDWSKSGVVKDFTNKDELEAIFNLLLDSTVEIIVTAFMEGQITEANYKKIIGKILAEGANGPTTREAYALLIQEITTSILPDTLVNAGGVLVSDLEGMQADRGREYTRAEVLTEMETVLNRAVENTLAQRTEKHLIRPAFDRVGLFNLAQARMKKLIDAHGGELNAMRAARNLANVFEIQQRIENLKLKDYWQAALKRNFVELEGLITRKCDGEGIVYDPAQLHLWLESIAKLDDKQALETRDPNQGPLVFVRVLRRVLVEEETVEETMARLHYSERKVVALRKVLSNMMDKDKDRYALSGIYNYLRGKGLLRPPDAASVATDGGINLNTEVMRIDQTGDEDSFWETPTILPGQGEKIKGLKPFFIGMQRVNVPALLGLTSN